jgi:hypothetical protein
MDEWFVWIKKKMKKMNFIMNVANKHYFCKKFNKRNNVEFMLFFQNNSTNEMFKSHFEVILHISLIWNIFKLANI